MMKKDFFKRNSACTPIIFILNIIFIFFGLGAISIDYTSTLKVRFVVAYQTFKLNNRMEFLYCSVPTSHLLSGVDSNLDSFLFGPYKIFYNF